MSTVSPHASPGLCRLQPQLATLGGPQPPLLHYHAPCMTKQISTPLAKLLYADGVKKVACMHACNLQLIFLVALYVSAAAVQNPTLKADGQATAKTASGSCNGGCAKSNTPR